MLSTRRIVLALVTAVSLHAAPAWAQGRSFDPSSDKAPSAVFSYLESHDIKLTSIAPFASGITSWQVSSPDGETQEIHVLSDGLTFLAGSAATGLAPNEQPGAPDVLLLGEVAPGVKGWLPRSWMGQALNGVLYVVDGAPAPLKGYAYHLFPDRDIIDNLSAMQLLQAAAAVRGKTGQEPADTPR